MRIHLVGGFLGSGKTTAIIAAAKQLMAQGKLVGVVTNDQGKYLIDTAFVQLSGIPAVEVTGGCFCCNYDDLDERLEQLQNDIHPDVVFAESVGSCGDLVATVVKPLIELREVASATSLSAFTDGRLLQMRLRGEELPFSENVVYIFDKQIEEAPLLVINKIDLLDDIEAEELANLARDSYPDKTILMSNSHTAEDVRLWVREIETENLERSWKSLDMDYQRYGDGEAQLAWLDEEVNIEALRANTRDLAILLISTILNDLQTEKAAIGHLKFLLHADVSEVKVSFTSLEQPDWQSQIPPLHGTSLKVAMNARVEIAAQRLHEIIRCAVQKTADAGGGLWSESDLEYFHPGFPNPTHRIE